jgi:hypothetical protein
MNEPPKDVSFKKLLGKAQLKFKYSVVKTCAVQTNIFGGLGPFWGHSVVLRGRWALLVNQAVPQFSSFLQCLFFSVFPFSSLASCFDFFLCPLHYTTRITAIRVPSSAFMDPLFISQAGMH